MSSPFDDPTLTHGLCKECGIPVRTSSVNVYFDKLKKPIYGRTAGPHNWEHYIPDNAAGSAILAYHQANKTDINHPAEPDDGRSHEQDAERIEREGNLKYMEEGFKLSKQFDETLGRDELP